MEIHTRSFLFYMLAILSLVPANVDAMNLMDGASPSSLLPYKKDSESLLKWEAPMEYQNKWTYYRSGRDKEGRPVYVMEFGKWNIQKTINSENCTEMDIMNAWVEQLLARMETSLKEEIIEKHEKWVTPLSYIVIVDLDGFTPKELNSVPVVTYLLKLALRYEEAGRHTMHHTYCVNAHPLFESVYTMAKPLLGAVGNRLTMHGTNTSKWRPLLLRTIPKNQLTSWYGGSISPVIETGKSTPLVVYG